MISQQGRPAPVTQRVPALLVGLTACVVYWRTAYPTITWWDSSNYSLAAATLGVTSPPGSLLLTLLGWPIAHLPLGLTPAHALNLFTGVLAALTASLVFVAAMRLRDIATPAPHAQAQAGLAAAIAASAGALAFAFGATLWEHATKFTPYVLTALFTGLILWTMLRWWREADDPRSWRWLLLLAFIFGLDFSVHRTNALLMPGALAWVLIRDARQATRPRVWMAACGGLAAGLAVHLLVIVLARTTSSPLNSFEPVNLAAFWDYISLAGSGGGFLIDLWPRNSGLWSVQTADLLRTVRDNVLHVRGPGAILGALPAVAIGIGMVTLWRANRRLAIACLTTVVLQAALTVLYFNIPAEYFRSLDRHYLPVVVTLGVIGSYGLASVAARVLAEAAGPRRLVTAASLLALVPAAQLAANWRNNDASRRFFARDYAANALEALPPNAIYFTIGDNDTFPVLYLQAAEGVRPDVRIVNLSLANAAWYPSQLRRADPAFPLSLSDSARAALAGTLAGDTTLVVPGATESDTVSLHVTPQYGSVFVPSDIVLMDILRTNAWRRPVTFASTIGSGLAWLRDRARRDGVFWLVVPSGVAGPGHETLRANLVERYEFRGYADSSVTIDRETRTIAFQYYAAFHALLEAEVALGAAGHCADVVRRLLGALPPERLLLPGYNRDETEAYCSRTQ